VRKTSATDKIQKTQNGFRFSWPSILHVETWFPARVSGPMGKGSPQDYDAETGCSKQPSHQTIEYSFFICFSPPLLNAFLRTAFRKARTI
jgi:hypothetical protein